MKFAKDSGPEKCPPLLLDTLPNRHANGYTDTSDPNFISLEEFLLPSSKIKSSLTLIRALLPFLAKFIPWLKDIEDYS
jgi:hypothetical protein